MATIDQLLKKGSTKLPKVIGNAYDKALKIGSWVESGIDGYKTALAEAEALKRFLKRFDEKDPQAVYYAINSLLKSNPVKLPEYMSQQDFNMIRSLFSRKEFELPYTHSNGYRYTKKGVVPIPEDITNAQSTVKGGNIKVARTDGEIENVSQPLRGDSHKESLFQNISPLEWMGDAKGNGVYGASAASFTSVNRRENSTGYKEIISPYDGVEKLTTLGSLKTYLDQLSFGYKTWAGFEIGTDHLWDINMEPYHPNGGAIQSKFKPFPKYKVPKFTAGHLQVAEFDFGKYLPCIAYNLQFGNQMTRDIDLFNNSRMQFPVGFAYDMILTLSIVDDVYNSMKKYLHQCLNEMYDMSNNEAAPFYQSAFKVRLTIYRSGFEINYQTELIVCPINYTPIFDGQSDPQESRVDLELGVVGIVQPTKETSVIGENDWEKKTTWVDVTLNPNKR